MAVGEMDAHVDQHQSATTVERVPISSTRIILTLIIT